MLRVIRRMRFLSIIRISSGFCSEKPGLNQLPEPEEELDPIQVEFISKLLRGEYASALAPESEKEQKLSFDLVQMNHASQILNKLKNYPNPTVNELFLFVFAYSSYKSVLGTEIAPYLTRVLESFSQLSPSYLLKFYQMIYPLRDCVTLPPFPTLTDIPNDQLIELGYFLIKLYPNPSDLQSLLNLISIQDIITQPLLYLSITEALPSTLQADESKRVSEWFNLVPKQEDKAKIILHYLKKSDTSLLTKIDTLNFKELEIETVVDLLLECGIHNVSSEKFQRHFASTDLESEDLTTDTYLNIWILLTRFRKSRVMIDSLERFTKIPVPKDLLVYDIFTLMMSAMVLQQKQFLTINQELLDHKEMGELNGMEIYALWKGAKKYQLSYLLAEIKKNCVNRKDLLQDQKKEILSL